MITAHAPDGRVQGWPVRPAASVPGTHASAPGAGRAA